MNSPCWLIVFQKDQITHFEAQFSVRIELKRRGKLNQIKVEGQKLDVFSAVTQIHKLLQGAAEVKKFKEHAEVLGKQVGLFRVQPLDQAHHNKLNDFLMTLWNMVMQSMLVV